VDPEDRRYTEEHEWARPDGDRVTVGITRYAQDQLGDIVYVELPQVGAQIQQSQAFGVVESVKTASDLYSPLSGEVVEVNQALKDRPELVNQAPYDEGWMIRVRPSQPAQLESLMDAAQYARHVGA
jgi:glycine cleavage system H protein